MVPQLRSSGSGNPKSHNVIGQLLLLVVVHCLLTPVQSVSGVIWDKERNDFVPIISKPIFAAMNQKHLSRSRGEETYNFQGRTFKFSYFEIDDVIHTVKNGTGISGYIGETWNILAEYLNLTLKPDRSSANTLGFPVNGSFTSGLLNTIRLNQTDIVARIEVMPLRLAAAQFTFPLKYSRKQNMSARHRLSPVALTIRTNVLRDTLRRTCLNNQNVLIMDITGFGHGFLMKANRQHITNWMLKLYSRKVWFAILATYTILSVSNYVFYVIEAGMFKENMIPGMVDYFFYNLGMMCSQSCNTSSARRCSRLVEYLMGLFALLINTAFNAVVFGYMTQVVTVSPFYDLTSLLENTEYSVAVLNGSTLHELFEGNYIPNHSSRSSKKRFFVVQNITEMFTDLCTDELVTTYMSDEQGKSVNYPCKLQNVGTSLVVSISSAISWQFQHKRSIDIALMKLYESGILHALHRQWLKWWQEDINSGMPEAIVMGQVHFIFMVLFVGLLMSLIILVLEHITFHCNK